MFRYSFISILVLFLTAAACDKKSQSNPHTFAPIPTKKAPMAWQEKASSQKPNAVNPSVNSNTNDDSKDIPAPLNPHEARLRAKEMARNAGILSADNESERSNDNAKNDRSTDRPQKSARVRLGLASIQGPLSKEAIRKIVVHDIDAYKSCYETELNKDPSLEARIEIKFIVSGTGAVQKAMVENRTNENSRLGDCIAGEIQKLKFPQLKGGGVAIVSYPFLLSQEN